MASEIFAERWTPLVLRELCAGQSLFNDIHRGVPLMSRTLLAQRLRELVQAGVVVAEEKSSGRGWAYQLSTGGRAFCPIIDQLGDWGTLFARHRIERESCDPRFLMWALRSYADRRLLPEQRLVVRFGFHGLPPEFAGQTHYWLLASDGELDVCWNDPGFDLDADVRADVTRFAKVWLGHLGLAEAVRDGSVQIEGAREMVSLVRRLLDLREVPAARTFHFG